ncbi:unnamed protein product [Meloidogyne enterolobii]|uniref:Uncharacterized protein n=1 Tax=Meloidogyne enterolobii TaxID=390850 RepID=A0ACB1AEV2_MELEN
MNNIIILSFLIIFLSKNDATFEKISRQNFMNEFNKLGETLDLYINRKVDNDSKMIITNDRIEKCQKIISTFKKEGEEYLVKDIERSVILIQGILFCARYLHGALWKYFTDGKKVKEDVDNDYIFLRSKLKEVGLDDLKKQIIDNELKLKNLNENELEKIIGNEMAKGNIQLINDKLIYCQINQNDLKMVKFGEALQLVGEVINFYFEKERFLPTKNDIPFFDEINELDKELNKEMNEIEQKINEEKLVEQIEEMKIEKNDKDIKMFETINSQNTQFFNLAKLAIDANISLLKFILSPIEAENEEEYLEREINLQNNFILLFEDLNNNFGLKILINNYYLIPNEELKNNNLFKLISKLLNYFYKIKNNKNIKRKQKTWKRKILIKKFQKLGENSLKISGKSIKRKRSELWKEVNQKNKKRITANDYLKQREKVLNI